jgi:hypothetical protein
MGHRYLTGWITFFAVHIVVLNRVRDVLIASQDVATIDVEDRPLTIKAVGATFLVRMSVCIGHGAGMGTIYTVDDSMPKGRPSDIDDV